MITFKLIELLKVEEEPIEPTVELVHIFLAKLTFKCLLLKSKLMLKNKVKPDKLQKEKFQLVNIDPQKFYLNLSFINLIRSKLQILQINNKKMNKIYEKMNKSIS